jgi:hypothetical protein
MFSTFMCTVQFPLKHIHICECRGVEFQSAATTAYMVVFAAHHEKLIQNIVIEAIQSLPTRAWLMSKINEEGE